MNNCIVSKLRAAIPGNFPGLYDLALSIVKRSSASLTNDDRSIVIKVDSATTITSNKNVFGSTISDADNNPTSSFSIPANTNTTVYVANEDCTIIIPNKNHILTLSVSNESIIQINALSAGACENITNLQGVHGDISYLDGIAPKYNYFRCKPNTVGNISVFSNPTSIRASIILSNSGCIGDIANLNNTRNINVSNTAINGNLSSVGGCSNFTAIYLVNTNIACDIDNFIASQISAGRSSVSSSNCPYIEFDGTFTFGNLTFASSSRMHIVWGSGANKVALHTGSNTLSNCNVIYEKGYESSTISEWKDAGKTVISLLTGEEE